MLDVEGRALRVLDADMLGERIEEGVVQPVEDKVEDCDESAVADPVEVTHAEGVAESSADPDAVELAEFELEGVNVAVRLGKVDALDCAERVADGVEEALKEADTLEVAEVLCLFERVDDMLPVEELVAHGDNEAEVVTDTVTLCTALAVWVTRTEAVVHALGLGVADGVRSEDRLSAGDELLLGEPVELRDARLLMDATLVAVATADAEPDPDALGGGAEGVADVELDTATEADGE